MIRWKYVLPRFALCLLIVTFLLLAVNPLIRTSIVRSGQAVTGARVEIDKVRTSLKDMRVELEGFRAADPAHAMRNLFEAECVKLDIDSAALSRRQILVRRGQVTGLELGTDRTNSGALPGTDCSEYVTRIAMQFESFGRNWLLRAAEHLNRGMQQDLQSVQVAQELLHRWPDEYAAVAEQSQDLQARIQSLSSLLAQAGDNPLRNVTSYQQAVLQLQSLSREVSQVRGRMQRLQQQILMDRDALAQACQHDEELVRAQLDFGELRGEQLSEYLLGPEVARRISEALNWVHWGRQYVPALAQSTHAMRPRGRNVFFPGLRRSPTVLIDTLVLRGTADLGPEPTILEGVIRGLSSDPEAYGKPTELVIQTTGTVPVCVQAILDATSGGHRDQLVIDCPCLPQPERMLGTSQQLSVVVSPGNLHLWIKLELEGEQLGGEIVLKQSGVQLQSRLAESYGGADVAHLVNETLASVNRMEASILLGGTSSAPTWTLRSNLGAEVALGLHHAFQHELTSRRTQMVQQAHAKVQDQLSRLEEQLLEQRQSVLDSLAAGDLEIERVQRAIASRVNLHDAVVDPQSPLREVFRR